MKLTSGTRYAEEEEEEEEEAKTVTELRKGAQGMKNQNQGRDQNLTKGAGMINLSSRSRGSWPSRQVKGQPSIPVSSRPSITPSRSQPSTPTSSQSISVSSQPSTIPFGSELSSPVRNQSSIISAGSQPSTPSSSRYFSARSQQPPPKVQQRTAHQDRRLTARRNRQTAYGCRRQPPGSFILLNLLCILIVISLPWLFCRLPVSFISRWSAVEDPGIRTTLRQSMDPSSWSWPRFGCAPTFMYPLEYRFCRLKDSISVRFRC
jgi:hypothetical protein